MPTRGARKARAATARCHAVVSSAIVDAASLRVGDAVALCGLRTDRHNGATGVIRRISEDGARCAVDCAHGPGQLMRLSVLRAKLRPLPRPITYSPTCTRVSWSAFLDPTDLRRRRDGTSSQTLISFLKNLEMHTCTFARARPWELPHSDRECVCIALFAADGSRLRQACVSLVGTSGNAFGIALFQSYAHFVKYRDDQDSSGTLLGMPLYAGLYCKDSHEPYAGEDSTVLLTLCHRTELPDDEELALVAVALALLPGFWEGLVAGGVPPPPWLVPLSFAPHTMCAAVDLGGLVAAARAELQYPATSAPGHLGDLPARVMRNATPSCRELHAAELQTLSEVIAHHRSWLEEHDHACHEAVSRKLALAYALAELREVPAHREAIDLCLQAVAAEPSGDDPNGARGMLLDFALTAGDDEAVLHGLSTFADWHDEDVLWNSVLMWFRARGSESKQTLQALHKAIALAPEVYPLLVRDRLMPLKGSLPNYHSIHSEAGKLPQRCLVGATRYVVIHRMHWRCCHGALAFLRNYGAAVYAGKDGTTCEGMSVKELLRALQTNVPMKAKVMCAFCRRLAHLKKCSGCASVWYCSPECQKKHWKMGHKEACTRPANS